MVVLLNFGRLVTYHRQLSFVAKKISIGLMHVLINQEELVASRRPQRMGRMLKKGERKVVMQLKANEEMKENDLEMKVDLEEMKSSMKEIKELLAQLLRKEEM